MTEKGDYKIMQVLACKHEMQTRKRRRHSMKNNMRVLRFDAIHGQIHVLQAREENMVSLGLMPSPAAGILQTREGDHVSSGDQPRQRGYTLYV